MSGFLSKVFDDAGPQPQSSEAHDAPQDGDGQSESEQHADGHGEAHFDPTVHAHGEMGGSYQDEDGSTHEWQHTEDTTISANADVAANFIADTESDAAW